MKLDEWKKTYPELAYHLPDGLTVGGSLDLEGTGITSLPDGLTVGGSLYLDGTGITSLPDGTFYAYKRMNFDGTCRDQKYEAGETYEIHGKPSCCRHGFHACTHPYITQNFYDKDQSFLWLVEILGDVDEDGTGKVCTNKIKIVRQMSVEEAVAHWNKIHLGIVE
jgi:hypothetical protein